MSDLQVVLPLLAIAEAMARMSRDTDVDITLDFQLMPTRDRAVFFLGPFGTLHESKAFEFRVEYGHKAET